MSKKRGTKVQRLVYSAIQEVCEAAGWSCRLDYSRSGGTQHALLQPPEGAAVVVPLHGTVTSDTQEVTRAKVLVRRIIRKRTGIS